MPVSKKRKFERKSPKQYRMVAFETDLFEGEFVFPDQQHFTVGLLEALNSGDLGKLCTWLLEAGVEADAVDAVRSLDQGEVSGFLEAWGKGSLASVPKSGA